MVSETLESHLEGYDIVKACLSTASKAPDSHLEGHEIVNGCLSTASRSHLERHDIVKVSAQKYSFP